jgi:hypothetical protein
MIQNNLEIMKQRIALRGDCIILVETPKDISKIKSNNQIVTIYLIGFLNAIFNLKEQLF